MADYAITSVARRVVYSGSAGTGPYNFSFPVLTASDLKVYKNTTLQTLTTHYTVSIGGAGTGSVTLGSAASSDDTITIVGARTIERASDFVTAGDLLASSLNTELDSQTIFVQQVSEEAARSIKAPVTDPTSIDMELPVKADRLNKLLRFNATTGDPEAVDEIGDFTGNWAASTAYVQRDIVKDTSNNNIYIANTAHTSSGSQPITSNTDSAKWDLIVDAASATTSATNAATSATLAQNWASKTDGTVASSEFAAKAWAIGGTGVTDTSGKGAAKEWAIETSGTVDGTDYSAKHHATAASTSASTASTQATNSSNSATASASSATAAASSATAAASSATSAAASYDSFDDRYLGAKSSDPSVDNDGSALLTGALYFNTSANNMRVYSGSAWVVIEADTNDKAKVSANDTTAGYLNGKLVAGTNITFAEGSDGGNETLTITATDLNTKALVSANDTTAGFLATKLQAGTNVTFTEGNDGGNETLTIAATGAAQDVSATATPTFAGLIVGPGTDSLANYVGWTSFTPVLTFGGNSVGITYSNQLGHYTRIGDTCYWGVCITLTSKGSSTGAAKLTAFPFTIADNGNRGSSFGAALTYTKDINLDISGGYYSAVMMPSAGEAIYLLNEIGDNLTPTELTDADFGDATRFRASGFYRI